MVKPSEGLQEGSFLCGMIHLVPSSGGSKAKGSLSLRSLTEGGLLVEGSLSCGEAVLPTECWLCLIRREDCGVQWMVVWDHSTVASWFFQIGPDRTQI
jgi:hypothetical protein